ncbi:hypothetical protein SEVIR_9G483701v4 [Setaria viridis]
MTWHVLKLRSMAWMTALTVKLMS